MEKIIFHIDVNNAFLSWSAVEYLKHGMTEDIRKIDSAIAGDPNTRTGIILAKSPSAKAKGVKTGEPIFQAKKKCKNLKIFPPQYEIYHKNSLEFRKILAKYSDKVEPFSIDEAFLEYVPLFGSYMEVARKIQNEIFNTLGFTVNIGIGPNKLLAKMASDFEKPNKIHTLFKEEIPNKMWPLPIEELIFLGKSSAEKLHDIGIKTIYDIAHTDVETLTRLLKSHGKQLYDYSWGIADATLCTERNAPKSISNSITTVKDLDKPEDILQVIYMLCNKTASRLRIEHLKCKTITVTLKTNYFKSYSSSYSLTNYSNLNKEIENTAKNIFFKMYKSEPVRLVGVGLSNLKDAGNEQLSLFDTESVKQNKIDKTVDELILKFGENVVITRGSCIKKK